ncbi:phosphatidylinositol-glycan biosynthesis class F protein isoform X1 [Dasypus novemcinctus]|uniref:phosphatidylinositol-glycan biosynthesis class F protein isoform X1 n=1 Tax=Dasypus novemcinctus TaxID=9361 RepID=UPI0026600B8E|nr:phosphatidylinositol-glycan biosynthesis class F protein isoform X1 [Dasypus novemcinctus]XP_058134482.1 phosphatidylinositol-glycan biosynthesis class F protein isoform X1 [Dasypus novemcinctus]XP_058134483.1 phosphatidylinositol-glycan biosynthesis class F protein isoform X1 [Dasypus novemcinctus]
MKDTDIKRLSYAHLLCIFSIILSISIPPFFLENFSILETHLTWLCICSIFVTAVNLVLYLVMKPNASSKRSSLSHKVPRFLKSCIYFLMSCFFFHVIFVLYGAPLIELVLETFLFAVILSTFTTIPCLCLLGPNTKAWLRVFSRNGVTSIWENSLQITTISSFVGTWLGALPIPLDWERPWQEVLVIEPRTLYMEAGAQPFDLHPLPRFFLTEVWPISCTLGATFGYVAGLIISPLWIYWNRKQLTYKNN